MFLLVVVGVLTSTEIAWTKCPPGQHGNDCTSIEHPLDPADMSKGNITSFVRRFYGESPTGNSVWMFAGGPGDTADSFSGAPAFFLSIDPTATIYLMDQRGVGLSSPLNCASPPLYDFNPNNKSIVAGVSKCNDELITAHGTSLSYYSTYYAALDYKATIDAINPEKVAIYALSFGTYALNSYLLVGGRADVLVMDGPGDYDVGCRNVIGSILSRSMQ
jgi:pimeloyl-ACP methyl ester carboxylesterase